MTHTPIQRLALLFIAAACAGAAAYITMDVMIHPRNPVGPAPEPLWPAPSFEMVDQDGQPFASDKLRGKVWVGGFFFTSCPMICPQMNKRLAELQAEVESYGDELADARLVSISIDPETDRPPRLKEYAQSFGAKDGRWHFLTHPEADRDAVWEMVGVEGFKMTLHATPDDPRGNVIEHSPRFLLIGRDGMVRNSYDSRDDEAMTRLLHDLRAVAAEPPRQTDDARPAAAGPAS